MAYTSALQAFQFSMKKPVPLCKMPADSSLPLSLQSWLGHELEQRGIDAIVYTRYILSILQQETRDDNELADKAFFPPCGRKPRGKVSSSREEPDVIPEPALSAVSSSANKSRGVRSKNKVKRAEKRKSSDTSADEWKKSAAIQCLLSVTDEDSGIEGLVDELCLKLKETKVVKEPTPDMHNVSFDTEGSDSVISTSPDDPAERYYAAFPALSDKCSTSQPQTAAAPEIVWAKVIGPTAGTDENHQLSVEPGSLKKNLSTDGSTVTAGAKKLRDVSPHQRNKNEKRYKNKKDKMPPRLDLSTDAGCGLKASTHGCSGPEVERMKPPQPDGKPGQEKYWERKESNMYQSNRAVTPSKDISSGSVKARKTCYISSRSTPTLEKCVTMLNHTKTSPVNRLSTAATAKGVASLACVQAQILFRESGDHDYRDAGKCPSDIHPEIQDSKSESDLAFQAMFIVPKMQSVQGPGKGNQAIPQNLMSWTQCGPVEEVELPTESEATDASSACAADVRSDSPWYISEDGELPLTNLEDLSWYTDPLDFILPSSPVHIGKERLYQRSASAGVDGQAEVEEDVFGDSTCPQVVNSEGDQEHVNYDLVNIQETQNVWAVPSHIFGECEPMKVKVESLSVEDAAQQAGTDMGDVLRKPLYQRMTHSQSGGAFDLFSEEYDTANPNEANVPVESDKQIREEEPAIGMAAANDMNSLVQQVFASVLDGGSPDVSEPCCTCVPEGEINKNKNSGLNYGDYPSDVSKCCQNKGQPMPEITQNKVPDDRPVFFLDGDFSVTHSNHRELDDYTSQTEALNCSNTAYSNSSSVNKPTYPNLLDSSLWCDHKEEENSIYLLVASAKEAVALQSQAHDLMDYKTLAHSSLQKVIAYSQADCFAASPIANSGKTWFWPPEGHLPVDAEVLLSDFANCDLNFNMYPSLIVNKNEFNSFQRDQMDDISSSPQSKIWDINAQRKLEGDPSQALSSTVKDVSKYLLNLKFEHPLNKGTETDFIEGGLYGGTWTTKDTDAWSSTRSECSEEYMDEPEDSEWKDFSPTPVFFRQKSISVDFGAGNKEDPQVPVNTSGATGTVEIQPSETSAFRDSIPPRHLPHVHSEPLFLSQWFLEHVGDAGGILDLSALGHKLVQVKHLYKSDVSILRHLGLVAGDDFDEEDIQFSPNCHFRPIQTPHASQEGTPRQAVMEEDVATVTGSCGNNSDVLDEMFCIRAGSSRTTGYQLYLGEETESVSFVPRFKVFMNHEKCSQTGNSTPGPDAEECDRSLTERLLVDMKRVLTIDEDEEEEEKDRSDTLTVQELKRCLDARDTCTSQSPAVPEEGCATELPLVVDGPDHVGPQALAFLWPAVGIEESDGHEEVISSCPGYKSIWSTGEETALPSLPPQTVPVPSPAEHAEQIPPPAAADAELSSEKLDAPKGVHDKAHCSYSGQFPCDFSSSSPILDAMPNYHSAPSHVTLDLHSCIEALNCAGAADNGGQPEGGDDKAVYVHDDDDVTADDIDAHRALRKDYKNWCSAEEDDDPDEDDEEPDDGPLPEWLHDLDDVFADDSSDLNMMFAFEFDPPEVPVDHALYSTQLEEEWLNKNHNFEVQVPKKPSNCRPKIGHKKKPCTFFMEGHCRRPDCKFAHDVSRITCRFWEEGDCFKGITCPFLHGYPRDSPCDSDSKDPDFTLETRDFPELNNQEQKKLPETVVLAGKRKRKASKSMESADNVRSSYLLYRQHAKEGSKIKAKSLPVDIRYPKD